MVRRCKRGRTGARKIITRLTTDVTIEDFREQSEGSRRAESRRLTKYINKIQNSVVQHKDQQRAAGVSDFKFATDKQSDTMLRKQYLLPITYVPASLSMLAFQASRSP